MKMTKEEKMRFEKAVREAKESPILPEDRQRPSGCGRVYVTLVEHKGLAVINILKRYFRVTQKPYSEIKNHIYVGYDNNSGYPLAEGNKIERILRSRGISAYMDAQGD